MTGKRPRALTRTASVSQLGSGSLSQEFSPLVENPKERLKVSGEGGGRGGGGVVGKEAGVSAVACARRVVIGFDPKPAGCEYASPKSAPCSPCFSGGGDDASSPRSVLGSLFSRPQQSKPAKPAGLLFLLHDAKKEVAEARSDHIAIPVREEVKSPPREAPVVAHSRRHSHPIPTPGISACHFSRLEKPAAKASTHHVQQPVARPVLGWLEHDAVKVDRRDTFLLGASPSRSLAGEDAGAALTVSSHFLDECSFCKRHLPEDKDIFMYRGDKAFCSVECRSQQMLMDERSKNCSSSAFKRTPGSAAPSQRTRVAPASSVAAA